MTEDVTNYTHGRLVPSTYTVTLQSLLAPGPKVHLNTLYRQETASLATYANGGLHSKDTPYCRSKYTSVFPIAVSQSPCSQGPDGGAPAHTHIWFALVPCVLGPGLTAGPKSGCLRL